MEVPFQVIVWGYRLKLLYGGLKLLYGGTVSSYCMGYRLKLLYGGLKLLYGGTVSSYCMEDVLLCKGTV
jgi:hypothetical protein